MESIFGCFSAVQWFFPCASLDAVSLWLRSCWLFSPPGLSNHLDPAGGKNSRQIQGKTLEPYKRFWLKFGRKCSFLHSRPLFLFLILLLISHWMFLHSLILCPFLGCLFPFDGNFHGINHPVIWGFFFFFSFTFLHPFCLLIYSFIIHFPTALVTRINFLNIPFHFLISLPIRWTFLIHCVIFSPLHYFIPHLICYISSLLIHSLSHFPITSLIPCRFSPICFFLQLILMYLFAVCSFYTFSPCNLEPKFLLHLPLHSTSHSLSFLFTPSVV